MARLDEVTAAVRQNLETFLGNRAKVIHATQMASLKGHRGSLPVVVIGVPNVTPYQSRHRDTTALDMVAELRFAVVANPQATTGALNSDDILYNMAHSLLGWLDGHRLTLARGEGDTPEPLLDCWNCHGESIGSINDADIGRTYNANEALSGRIEVRGRVTYREERKVIPLPWTGERPSSIPANPDPTPPTAVPMESPADRYIGALAGDILRDYASLNLVHVNDLQPDLGFEHLRGDQFDIEIGYYDETYEHTGTQPLLAFGCYLRLLWRPAQYNLVARKTFTEMGHAIGAYLLYKQLGWDVIRDVSIVDHRLDDPDVLMSIEWTDRVLATVDFSYEGRSIEPYNNPSYPEDPFLPPPDRVIGDVTDVELNITTRYVD